MAEVCGPRMKQTLYPPGGTRIGGERSKLKKTSSRRRSIWTRGIKASLSRKPEEPKNLQHLVEKQYQWENQRHPQRRKPWQKYLCAQGLEPLREQTWHWRKLGSFPKSSASVIGARILAAPLMNLL